MNSLIFFVVAAIFILQKIVSRKKQIIIIIIHWECLRESFVIVQVKNKTEAKTENIHFIHKTSEI